MALLSPPFSGLLLRTPSFRGVLLLSLLSLVGGAIFLLLFLWMVLLAPFFLWAGDFFFWCAGVSSLVLLWSGGGSFFQFHK